MTPTGIALTASAEAGAVIVRAAVNDVDGRNVHEGWLLRWSIAQGEAIIEPTEARTDAQGCASVTVTEIRGAPVIVECAYAREDGTPESLVATIRVDDLS